MRILPLLLTASLSSILMLSACTPKPPAGQSYEALRKQESQSLNEWFEARYNDELARSPMTRTYLGDKSGQDKLDDSSQLALDEGAALQSAWLKEMRETFDTHRLDDQSRLSYRLYEYQAQDALAAHALSGHDYVFTHMSGPHTSLPAFMINYHTIETAADAKAYVERLQAFGTYLEQYAQRAEAQFEQGIMLPAFVYPKLIEACRNVITGAPFSNDGVSPLSEDFGKKSDAMFSEFLGTSPPLPHTPMGSIEMGNSAQRVMINHVQPAYENLIAMFERHYAAANNDAGIWKLPDGEAYYAARLKHYTTTDLTADEIHELGIKDVARIQAEMRGIIQSLGFKGSLREFFNYLRSDPKFTYPNDDASRERYITEATDIIDSMKNELDDLFITKPKADMIVKRVEPFREDSAFGAFYNQPSSDGSRPGTYYINLKDMTALPIYQMQALAYHEGIPGHHMQIAVAQELEGLPKFRTRGRFTAYNEGWALYAESLPKELGLYTDPYQDFGRLSMEIFRAARLVVDTGIHAKKWTREQAVDYMMENTANSEGDIRAEVDRYIVWPGQATAYKIGMLKITELRTKAEDALGDKFDLRAFHNVILANGPVPLTVLEELADEWIRSEN